MMALAGSCRPRPCGPLGTSRHAGCRFLGFKQSGAASHCAKQIGRCNGIIPPHDCILAARRFWQNRVLLFDFAEPNAWEESCALILSICSAEHFFGSLRKCHRSCLSLCAARHFTAKRPTPDGWLRPIAGPDLIRRRPSNRRSPLKNSRLGLPG